MSRYVTLHSDQASPVKPRICFVGLRNLAVLAREYNAHGIGGEELQHTLLARALAARGYETSMVVMDYGQADGGEWEGIKTYKTYRPEDGMPVLRFFHPRWTGVWAALKRADADIYYLSCASLRVGLTSLFSRRHRRKLVFRIASDMDCEPRKLLIEYNYWRDRRIYEYGLRRADAILAQSVHQQDAMRRNYGLASTLASMLVDQPREVLTWEQRTIPVLWVSNIRQLKRPDLVLEFAAGMPETAVHLIGGRIADSANLFDVIHQRAGGLPNVVFHGQIPYHDVNDYFAKARVFMNTSDIEGFPNSYLQAWSRGTPVVAFFDPDGLIAREGLGVVVRDMKEMRQAVEELTTNRERWLAVSARCVAFMRREFNEERILEPYLETFRRVVGRRSPG
jgi:glycosyltransferase involved in cell wall biosynthesis